MLSIDRVRAAENGFRYELWESMTGGDSWSVRQVDSKPVPSRRLNREPTMRIHTDRSGKVHRIQRRAGDTSDSRCILPRVGRGCSSLGSRPRGPAALTRAGPGGAYGIPSGPPAEPRKPPSLRKN